MAGSAGLAKLSHSQVCAPNVQSLISSILTALCAAQQTLLGMLQVSFTLFHNLLSGRLLCLGPEYSPKLGRRTHRLSEPNGQHTMAPLCEGLWLHNFMSIRTLITENSYYREQKDFIPIFI